MQNPRALVSPTPLQPRSSVSDKNLAAMLTPQQADSLKAWIQVYTTIHVKGAPLKTQQAKARDLDKFIRFVQVEIGHDHIDGWTPAVTKAFQQQLLKMISPTTEQPYKGFPRISSPKRPWKFIANQIAYVTAFLDKISAKNIYHILNVSQ
jgi:uncharacterized protein YfaT (DUF1175 family)